MYLMVAVKLIEYGFIFILIISTQYHTERNWTEWGGADLI